MRYLNNLNKKFIFILPVVMIYFVNFNSNKNIIPLQTYIYMYIIMSVIIPISFLSNIIMNFEIISKYKITTNNNINFWLNKKLLMTIIVSSLLIFLYFCIFIFIFGYKLKWNVVFSFTVFLPIQTVLEYLVFCNILKQSVNLQLISIFPILKFALIYLLYFKDINLNFFGIFIISIIYISNIWTILIYTLVLLLLYFWLSNDH